MSPAQLREPFFLILNYSLNQEAVCERSKYELFWRSGLMETGDNVEEAILPLQNTLVVDTLKGLGKVTVRGSLFPFCS